VDDWSWNEEEGYDRAPMIGRGPARGLTWVGGVPMSATDHPECIDHDSFDCNECEFFGPSSCPLLHDLDAMDGLRSVWAGHRERTLRERRQDRAAQKAIYEELQEHGRPLHYSKLAAMVMDRHPQLDITPDQVLKRLQKQSKQFECVYPGVYRCL